MSRKLAIILVFVGIITLPLLFRRAGNTEALRGEDTLVVISPHPESNQVEFRRAFQKWYVQKTGRSVMIDWRYPGGLSDILRLVDSLYDNAFQTYWKNTLHQPWNEQIERGYCQNTPLDSSKPNEALVAKAREAFLNSEVSCGIDIFFGGGGQEFELQSQKGRLIAPAVLQTHPEWFEDSIFPLSSGGFRMRDEKGHWFGVVFSSYGIAYNEDVLKDHGVTTPPQTWEELGDPVYFSELALTDPTKSGASKQAFEMIIQTSMQKRFKELLAEGYSHEEANIKAPHEGWLQGMQLLQRMSANTRYFTEKSNRPVMSVASGNCAVGMALDFAALAQADNLENRDSRTPFGFISPKGGTAYTPDAIALFRGAPNRTVAELFIEFILSPEGQQLWGFKKGTPGGPEEYSLRRLPIRKDFYTNANNLPYRSDPGIDPYALTQSFDYRVDWTQPLLPVFHKLIRAAFIDPQEELRAAWGAIIKAQNQGKIDQATAALNILQDLSIMDYNTAIGPLKTAFSQRDPMKEAAISTQITQHFIDQYRQARVVAEK